jgi:hypothetical protein
MLLLMGSLSLAPVCNGDEFFQESEQATAPYEDQPPPNPLPAYAPRAKVEAHFPQPTRTFSLFESLTSYGAACRERCMPKMFSPRGVGFARRTSCDRMDYSPYVTKHDESSHGPSFYTRHHLAPCCQQHHFEKRGTHCGWSVYY